MQIRMHMYVGCTNKQDVALNGIAIVGDSLLNVSSSSLLHLCPYSPTYVCTYVVPVRRQAGMQANGRNEHKQKGHKYAKCKLSKGYLPKPHKNKIIKCQCVQAYICVCK